MLFHGSYFSNYCAWVVDPTSVKPSSHPVWAIVGQDIINSDVGGFFQGLRITSGLFNLWRSQGITTYAGLKASSFIAMVVAIFLIGLSFYIMHIVPLVRRSTLLSYKSVCLLAGLASISWCGHLVHISLPISYLLESGIDPSMIMSPQALLSQEVMRSIFPEFGKSSLVTFAYYSSTSSTSILSSSVNGFLDTTGSIPLSGVAQHHLFLGLSLLISGLLINRSITPAAIELSTISGSWHGRLAVSLLLVATLSFLHAHNAYSSVVYPYISYDYAATLSIFTHHMWIGGFLMVGSGAHASLYMVQEFTPQLSTKLISKLLSHRDILIGHLSWVVIFLGFHSFGLYIHNDTLQALGRPEDTFSDSAIQLKPIFSTLFGFSSGDTLANASLYVVGSRIVSSSQILGTSDFMIHHIHAFTIHTTALILVKGFLFSRSSRLVSDKSSLGFRYPCDGPGRGGTCQISPWDHIFLGLFWMYNSISILIFHFFWKLQSDVWGSVSMENSSLSISHLTSGDFCSNSNTINGWLRTFLWSQSAQVIQSYSTAISPYGIIFLGSHLIWAFSLMFLFSGRGYWQELIESILWSHHKLKVVPQIQPRALSISQGRAVGVSHYILGGIGCTFTFFLARMSSLS